MGQLKLPFESGWGGRREGAGRKPGGRRTVAHRTRPPHRAAHPVHVTLRARAGLPPFRERALGDAICAAIGAARRPIRVVCFSIQSNHLHLVVEARDAQALALGMQGLGVRLARAINGVLGARGGVFRERYHARELRTPREVRNALVYVLMNARKHGVRVASGVDPFSSAPWFDGFAFSVAPAAQARPTAAPQTWLLRTGWRRLGLIRRHERPS